MMKVTVLYGHPSSPEAFESYYRETHLPLARAIDGLDKLELTRFIAAPGAERPTYYRMAELYFASPQQMERSLGSPSGRAAVADLDNFATGGVTVVIGEVGV